VAIEREMETGGLDGEHLERASERMRRVLMDKVRRHMRVNTGG
jgi:hypothetical protein